jgi:2,5-diketo-D-gluconate reductase A
MSSPSLTSPALTMNDGRTIPQLGFGVFQVDPAGAVAPVRTALDCGYRLIDTAAAYRNEEGVGTAVRESGIARDELFITTKLWNPDQGYDSACRAFDTSMRLLGLEVLDLYLIHWPTPARDLYVASWKALESLLADGRVRSIGVSNFTVEHLDRLAQESSTVPVLNQIELHPRFPQPELRDYHAEHSILTQAWSPIGQGKGLLEDPALVALAGRLGRTPAQVVLRWHVELGIVVIPKSITPARIAENFDVFGFELSDDDRAVLAGMETGVRIGPDPATFNFV